MTQALAAKPRERDNAVASVQRDARSSSGVGQAQEVGVPRFLSGLGGLGDTLQAKLVVGKPGDACEDDADRVANAATQAGVDSKSTGHGIEPASVRTSLGHRDAVSAIPIPDSGSPLAADVRERVEPALGADLSHVKVHTGPSAQDMAKELGAKAFTHQNHIVLGSAQSPNDLELMAHEATHVVQQQAAPSQQGLVQRRPEDYEHPEDGATVQNRMGEQVAKAGGGEVVAATGAEATSTVTTPSVEEREASRSVDPAERKQKETELESYAKPPADRPAETQPQVSQAASDVKTEAEQPSEPLAEGQEKSPRGKKGAAAAAAEAAELGASAFAKASTEPAPDIPAPVQLPAPVMPVNADGESVQPDTAADGAAAQLGREAQRMRDEGLVARQRSTGLRANADRMRGNLRIARGATDSAKSGLTMAQEHVETRRGVAAQARDALSVSEEKAATVAAQAPEYGQRAAHTQEDSGPIATEARAKAGESRGNVPDDDEAAGKMQEQAGQMEKVGSDATSVDDAVTGTQAKGEALVQDAAQAQERNVSTSGKLDATDAAIEQTDARLTDLDQQNEAARAKIASVGWGPAQLDAGAANIDAQALAVLTASDALEAELHAVQDDFASDMRSVPGSKAVAAAGAAAETAPVAVIQRDAQTAYGDRATVDVLGAFRSPASAEARREQGERAERAARRRRQRLVEINVRAQGSFENLSAIDKMGIALDITGENLMGDLGDAKWPNILGQMALAFVDPAISLEGVVSGLNMTLSGAANLLSLQQWERDPLGNLLKSAADIATGLTIILGSIAGLCTAILVILGALAIFTLGAMGPAFAAASAFLGPIITTVGGWAISCAAIAAELQFYVLIKNLVDAATATTAEQLEHESDQMTEDATQAANMASQVVVAGVMETGGAALAETAVGQRLGAAATSVADQFDMLPPPRGAPLLEPGVAASPEVPVSVSEAGPAPVVEAVPTAEPVNPAPAVEPIAAPVSVSEPAAPAPRPAEAPPVTAPEPPVATRPPQPAEVPTPPHPTEPVASAPLAQEHAAAGQPPKRMGTVTASPEGIVEHPPSSPTVEYAPPRRGGQGRPREATAAPSSEGTPKASPEPRGSTPEEIAEAWNEETSGRRHESDQADFEASADDVGQQANPRTSESTSAPERMRAAEEAANRTDRSSRGASEEDVTSVPDEVPEGGLFDEPTEGPPTPESARAAYMGGTPGKYSATGKAVLERMRAEGVIEGDGPLLPGNPNGLRVKGPDGTWHLIDETIDMAHKIDAVRWWNDEGKYYGARSEPVREFMNDPDNYVLQPRGPNRSAGAKIGETYDPPER